MSNSLLPESQSSPESNESFGDLLSQFERSNSHRKAEGGKQLEGTVITVSAEAVIVDIGYKSEGLLPLTAFAAGEEVKPGDKLAVSVKGRDADGYYELSRFRTALPRDWTALQQAFSEKTTIMGTVTAVIKGGLSVDVGVRAFMPASRSGTREAGELEKLVGEEIRCRIIKLDVTDEDVVVDRRVVLEEEERATKERRYSEVKEGDTVQGEVRSLTDYGAFIDLGGVDGLLHVGDIAWGRVNKPEDVLSVGQQIEARVLKIEPEKRRISLGMKQLLPHPWDSLAERYKVGERVNGTVTRVMDFGAFVELEPGIEGLIHVSEMSWVKRVKKASDAVKTGDTVEVVILGVDAGERRISLGLKQTLGDPWADVPQRFPVGTSIEGPVLSITKFGAFVQLAEGVEGLVHISEITGEKRINHPSEVLKTGQIVKAQVLEIDAAKRQLRLSMKQMIPTGLDEFIAEHKEGDIVTGRIVEVANGSARVEIGEGMQFPCKIPTGISDAPMAPSEGKADLSSLSSMLKARWKGESQGPSAKADTLSAGQIRSFRLTVLNGETKEIGLELTK